MNWDGTDADVAQDAVATADGRSVYVTGIFFHRVPTPLVNEYDFGTLAYDTGLGLPTAVAVKTFRARRACAASAALRRSP